jgi:hypothetical protein
VPRDNSFSAGALVPGLAHWDTCLDLLDQGAFHKLLFGEQSARLRRFNIFYIKKYEK